MPKARKKKERTPATMSAAGLMSFFEEEIEGIGVRPEIVIISAIALMTIVIMAHLGLFAF